MKIVGVLLMASLAILAVMSVPWILFGAWTPFAGMALALPTAWIIGSTTAWLLR